MKDSGIYIRVDAENVLLEDMSESKRKEWLNGLGNEALIRCIDRLCECLQFYENTNKSENYLKVKDITEKYIGD